MNGYSQPEGYRFSHDSIELAQRAASIARNAWEMRSKGHETGAATSDETPQELAPRKVLDLCAGCGVVGLEFAKILRETGANPFHLEVDFLEVQPVYRGHFERNRDWAAPGLKSRWLEMNYAELADGAGAARLHACYDLIVSNPPYFDLKQGSLSPSEFKARSRFFIDSDFETLLSSTAYLLASGGTALILVRDLGDHNLNRESSLNRVFSSQGEWKWLDPIRGTGLVQFVRN